MSQISFSDIASNRGGSLSFRFPGDWMSHSCQTEGAQGKYTYSTTPHGYMGWTYGYVAQNGTTNTFTPFTLANYRNAHMFRDVGGWNNPSNNANPKYPFIGSNGECHPAVENGVNYWAVLKWVPPQTGAVKIRAFIADANEAGGNGVRFWLARMKSNTNNVLVANRESVILDGSTENYLGSYAEITKTETITDVNKIYYFVVGPDGDQNYDTTTFDLTIQYTSTPAAGSNISLTDQVLKHSRYKSCLPRYFLANGDPGYDDAYEGTFTGTDVRTNVKASFTQEAFDITLPARTFAKEDTLIGAASGNGELKVKLVFAPSWSTSSLNLINVYPPTGVSFPNYFERGYTSTNSSHELHFTNLVGGLYSCEGFVYKAAGINGTSAFSFPISWSTSIRPGRVWVERDLQSYV